MATSMDQVVVVGGGLAGVSACNTVVENGGKTVLIDKSSFCGGNSTKATSGINGADTKTQREKGIEDSRELFLKDTLKGGAKRPEIAKVLCENSGADVEWLMDAFDLDLSLVARLGGHSAPRTHRGKERFPGMTITYALIQMVEKISETTNKARIITKARATELLQGPGKDVIGLIYEKGGQQFKEMGPVILCSGGFGADFSNSSLLAKYRPDLLHLPTTNGEHCTGDGIKMGEAIGAKSVDLEWVQVHPTGLVKPDDADAKIKFLAAEALRGVGGLVLNKDGKRFANELGRRDYVTGEMWKNKPPFRLCLNNAASTEILWHCKHYTGRGVMKFYESGDALAKEMGVAVSVLEKTHQDHYDAAKKTEKDPDGGSWPAYPSGKSWDEASGPTGSGKKFYHNIIPGTAVAKEPFFVAIITPVIHYCMGGLEINEVGGVLNKAGKGIKGLYCAGEVAGGVHGNNRLGGNSLLDCVVFGRVAGLDATKYYLGEKKMKQVNLKVLTEGQQVIVVGGGLAGVSACNTVLENGGKTVLIDKSSFCGGNSTKATSGINGANTKTQRDTGIDDSKELFLKDTLKGGAKRPEIAKVLCENSGADVEWLMDAFDLDLSLVARLGGHSAPRTHRGKERFPGMTITYALIQMVEKVAENSNRARIITKARATELLQGSAKDVIGLVFEKDGKQINEYGPVILCSGGFGADFSNNSLLAQYRPDLLHLPTTNGEHCTGDGIKMGEAIGAKSVDLEWVQVHPTGLVKPDDADAKIKFLAAEALRGVGGLVLNKDGKRFANELGRRDYVTGEMWKNKPPFRLCLNNAASSEILWHCKHYTGRGVMKFYESGDALAKEMGIQVSVLEKTHQDHYDAAKKTEKDPDGGSWPAYPSGKSWDEASGPTGSGKKFYHNIISGSAVAKEPFFVAIITPVIHYCMGGLEINEVGGVLDKAGKAIKGLYCAGEVAGGVHGNNRLGGNSLLDCVVFGRVTGIDATKYYLGEENMKKTNLKALSGDAQVIVVGGGLAGVSACNTVVENGGKTVLIDKSSFCGGNSTKATSGINGADTKTQREKGIADSRELFVQDTLKGGAKRPEIARVLCENSGEDVNWLMDVFDLDLSLVARLGGHSMPRTHRGKERFPGMTITYALIQMVEKISETTDKARIITKARATELIVDASKEVTGLRYEKGGQTFSEMGPVILCSGGFGADFSNNSLLAKYRPDLLHLPTTNGEHCTGDGIKMGEAIGAKSVDLEWVQVHPTGLVKPDDADAKIKFLAAEALRGVGGLIINKDGKRFANELGRRDYVTGEMWKNKPPFRLALNKAASDEILWHCKHYTGRGVMKFYESGDALAKDMGIQVSVLEKTHDDHYQAAKKTEKDPDGGSWPAYPSGKSWDEASGPTGSGKKFYHNIIPGSAVKAEPFFVAIITPVIHYCMGGLEIDADGAVLNTAGAPIKGLYCAGEVAGGVHGNNRLGGNSLLDCVVFGRVTGKAAVRHMLGECTPVDLMKLTAGAVTSSTLAGGSYEDKMNDGKAGGAKKVKEKKEKKVKSGGGGGGDGGLTLAEVAKHTTKGDCWVVVNGDVINVGGFLAEHPGGELAILTFAGKDASEEFNMIHPPDVVPKYAASASFKILGKLGEGGGGAADDDDDEDESDDESEEEEEEADGGLTLAEVAKHTTKGDCWVVVNGDVINVGGFLAEHPGGELAILTFAGKDASEEFNMIHPPDVVPKYAASASFKILGKLGSGSGSSKPKKAKKSKSKGGAVAAAAVSDKGDLHANHAAWGIYPNATNWRHEAYDHNPGVFLVNVKAYWHAFWSLWLAILYEVCATIFTAQNIKINSKDRTGLTRSAILLVLFMVIHGVGNLHVFMGPDDFNGYGYFYVRLYWTGFGLPANIVEEYILLSAALHIFVGTMRTWDKRALVKRAASTNEKLNMLRMGISGVMLGTFMTIHLFQFRFGATFEYFLRPPPCLISFFGIPKLELFWTRDLDVTPVPVRDIYKLEYQIFTNNGNFWAFFYIFSVFVFMTHACWGWTKVTPALGVPKGHIARVEKVGYAIMITLGVIYISFPLYCMSTTPFVGRVPELQPTTPIMSPGA